MATHVQTLRATRRLFVFPVWRLNIFWRVRKDLLIGKLMLAFGLVLPLLMVAGCLPASLLLGFFSLGLIGVGGIVLLIRCGEIG